MNTTAYFGQTGGHLPSLAAILLIILIGTIIFYSLEYKIKQKENKQ